MRFLPYLSVVLDTVRIPFDHLDLAFGELGSLVGKGRHGDGMSDVRRDRRVKMHHCRHPKEADQSSSGRIDDGLPVMQ
jgi:hypothetical protein